MQVIFKKNIFQRLAGKENKINRILKLIFDRTAFCSNYLTFVFSN